MHMWWPELWLHSDAWNGSHSCSGLLCVPDVMPSTCQRGDSIPSTPRLELAFIWCLYSVHASTYSVILICTEYVLVHTLFLKLLLLLLCRILYWLFLHTLTPLRRITMMFPWRTVGLHAPSSSSPARKETRVGRKLDGVWMEMKCECDLCEYVLVQRWYIRVCTGTNNAFLNIWEQTFIWLWTTVGDIWSVGRVYGGTQAWSLCPLHHGKYMLVNWYIQVWTEYVPVHTSMYHDHWYISENAFLCPMTVGNDSLYAWHACCGIPTLNKCPYLCPKCMTLFWYILSTYLYVLWSFIYKSTYQYVLVCTSTNQVHTKNTVLVQLVTIPDECFAWSCHQQAECLLCHIMSLDIIWHNLT